MQNTIQLVGLCSENGIAAKLCYDLVLNGYSDWFLPSSMELEQLIIHKAAIAMNYTDSDHNFWSSSTSTGALGAIAWNCDNVQIVGFDRDTPFFVRAVRAF